MPSSLATLLSKFFGPAEEPARLNVGAQAATPSAAAPSAAPSAAAAPAAAAQSSPAPAPTADSTPPSAAAENVQHMIGKVSALTQSVAQDVGQHNINVQAISNELQTVAQNDPAAVAALICKLLVANQNLQGRLERAESTLQSHSRQLQDAVISSRTDGLTGLTNRRALDEELRRCLVELQGQGRPAALLMLDVDHFKRFNDTHGHVAGDHALVHVADMLRAHSRASDIVARFGGEEFAIVFTAVSAAAIRERAERMRQSIGSKHVVCDGREVRITASAGLTEAQADDGIADWLKRADAALYTAKRAGRDCGCLAVDGGVEPLVRVPATEAGDASHEMAEARSAHQAAAELAAEAFADTSFVPSVAKRIAEWKRGGATLTVFLAQLESAAPGDDESAEGSRVMRLALQCARGSVREMDLVSRWRNRGVGVLLPCTSAADAKSVARRLLNALAHHAAQRSEGEPISLCIGMAEGIEGNDAKRVLERAWLALQAARNHGPGEICVHDGVKTVLVKRSAAARA